MNLANHRHTWPHPVGGRSLRCCFPLMTNFMQKKLRDQLIFSREIDDRNILQYDWMRGITGHTQPKVVVSDGTFPWSLTPWIKNLHINYFFPKILFIKESCNLIGQEAHCPHPMKSRILRYYIPLPTISMQNIKIYYFQIHRWPKNLVLLLGK